LRETEDVPRAFAEADLVLGLLLLAHGEILDGQAHLDAAKEAALNSGSIPVAAAASGGLARMSLARGNARRAAEEGLGTLALVRRKGIWVWAAEVAPVATEALLTDGRREEVVALVDEVERGIRRRDAPAARAALSVCRALLAAADDRAEEAARAFSKAERAWLALPRPYEAARCREARSLVQLSSGLRGTDLLSGALLGFEALGASWDAARVRRSLREHGVLRPWRGGRRGYGRRLSPREQEVIRQAALGHTNKEIAEALVLSPRTVESHLARAMRKLDVRSRKALPPPEPE
jgi:DNA-binding CsgD family transcriptional regulator